MRFAYFAYRQWAFSILDTVLAATKHTASEFVLVGAVEYDKEKIDFAPYREHGLVILDPKDKEKTAQMIRDAQVDVALFYGWSWMVPDALTKYMDCLCLHPSLLPNYRGGTPFQHQILANEQSGGLTIFRMNDVLDGGDILAQRSFPLTGTLTDILNRVIVHGADATVEILKNYEAGTVVYTKQEHLDQFPPYKRRKPEDSILPFSRLQEMAANDLYNFVRALDDPFPNCCIVFPDGSRLLLQEVVPVSVIPAGGVLLTTAMVAQQDSSYLAVKDGAVKIVRSTLALG